MGRNQEQNEKAKKSRREKILSSALELFSTKGLSATKVSDIAQRASMAQGLLYHYFSSKEQIYVEIVSTAFERLNSACHSLENNDWPPHEKISRALETLIDSLDKSPDSARYHVLIAQAQLSEAVPGEAKAIIKEKSAIPYEVLSRIMTAGQRHGSIRSGSPDELATIFWTTIKGLAFHKAVHGDSPLPLATLFHSLFFKGVDEDG